VALVESPQLYRQSNSVKHCNSKLQLFDMMNSLSGLFVAVLFLGTGGAAAAALGFISFLQAAVKFSHQIDGRQSYYDKD
jgi:hypothetical protein